MTYNSKNFRCRHDLPKSADAKFLTVQEIQHNTIWLSKFRK